MPDGVTLDISTMPPRCASRYAGAATALAAAIEAFSQESQMPLSGDFSPIRATLTGIRTAIRHVTRRFTTALP